jgi:hypothetical protein
MQMFETPDVAHKQPGEEASNRQSLLSQRFRKVVAAIGKRLNVRFGLALDQEAPISITAGLSIAKQAKRVFCSAGGSAVIGRRRAAI